MIEIDELKTLLPHSGKMLLLSRVLNYCLDGSLEAEYDITPDCIFYDPKLDGVPSWTGFELIAQSASALLGITNRNLGIKPKVGFILSISSLKIDIPIYKNGSTINIQLNKIDRTDPFYTFEGKIYMEDKLAIKGKILVTEINDDDERFIEFYNRLMR